MNSSALKALLLAFALMPVSSSFAQNVPSSLVKEKKRLECMVSVVRAAPNTKNARYEIHDRRPQLKWHYAKGENSLDITFYGIQAPDKTWQYTGAFSGLSELGRSPDTFGASEIVDGWKAKCGVSGLMLFV